MYKILHIPFPFLEIRKKQTYIDGSAVFTIALQKIHLLLVVFAHSFQISRKYRWGRELLLRLSSLPSLILYQLLTHVVLIMASQTEKELFGHKY